MNTLLFLDKDSKTELSEDLKTRIIETLEDFGHEVDVFELGKNEVTPCHGCLRCVTKHPGECINNDIINEIKKNLQKYSVTFFLTPVLFGHYSSTIASPINKGTGSHNLQFIIGYGEDIDAEEKSTFIDLTARHRGKNDIVHPGMDKEVNVFVSESIEDNMEICRTIKTDMSRGR